MNDVERLKEENRRLKRTLLERFEETFYWVAVNDFFVT
jgi:hypothetical protein